MVDNEKPSIELIGNSEVILLEDGVYKEEGCTATDNYDNDITSKVKITNNIPENLIAVAMTQVGYEESKNNFEYDNDGQKNGYTRYGEW